MREQTLEDSAQKTSEQTTHGSGQKAGAGTLESAADNAVEGKPERGSCDTVQGVTGEVAGGSPGDGGVALGRFGISSVATAACVNKQDEALLID
jgi:hypothetical protein